jgi:hypothetical protein
MSEDELPEAPHLVMIIDDDEVGPHLCLPLGGRGDHLTEGQV